MPTSQFLILGGRATIPTFLVLILWCGFGSASGAPTTTITPNGLGTTVLPPVGGTYNIEGGTAAGNNLFHSFSTFNLGTGDTADFVVTSNVANILTRVTGGPSSIDGTITSTVGEGGPLSNANLFFINPAGVMFTANTQVNLGGSFVVSTANYVKLNDTMGGSGIFYTALGGADVLSSAPVSAFGFLGPTPAPISFPDAHG
jgi:filamentous hemagglutinin family protein